MTPDQIALVLSGQARMETELVEMRRAIVSLARVEERVAAYTIQLDSVKEDSEAAQNLITALEHRIDVLEKSQERYATIIGIIAGVIAIFAPYVIDFVLGK